MKYSAEHYVYIKRAFMSLINNIYLKICSSLLKEIEKSMGNPCDYQKRWLESILLSGTNTSFGHEHCFNRFNFSNKREYLQKLKYFQENVPIRDYDAFVPYINRIRSGENYVLWNQKVKWFAKSSGTSSDRSKFIPITPDSLHINHYGGFKRMLAWYVANNPQSRIFNGKALTLGGSVQLDEAGDGKSFYGDLSAILLKNSPAVVEALRTPKRDTALIADFNRKIEEICKESSRQNVTNFSGVPSWNLVLLNKILEYTGKGNILEVWPNLELFMHGGIGFEPYREIYRSIIPGSNMHYLENYNASEGYFAFQDDLSVPQMLLTVNNGIFYEFIPMDMFNEVMKGRIRQIPTLEDVKTGVNYAVVITTCNGLWRYLIGDCVKFTSLYPHRIQITGRTQLCINAFGEELMISNAEKALAEACRSCRCSVNDFTVAPVFMELTQGSGNMATPASSKGRHKWAIEFSAMPQDINEFADTLDKALAMCNSDYAAKREGNATMERLQIIALKQGTFMKWMESRNKLGGQNKVPRLYGDSRFIDELTAFDNKF